MMNIGWPGSGLLNRAVRSYQEMSAIASESVDELHMQAELVKALLERYGLDSWRVESRMDDMSVDLKELGSVLKTVSFDEVDYISCREAT